MPVEQRLWTVDERPIRLEHTALSDEKTLERMILAEPAILSDHWMVIGQQELADGAGVVDLLAIAPDASLILIELKRDKTPRDVVAQTLDYASWLVDIGADDVAAILR